MEVSIDGVEGGVASAHGSNEIRFNGSKRLFEETATPFRIL